MPEITRRTLAALGLLAARTRAEQQQSSGGASMSSRLFTFAGGKAGDWVVTDFKVLAGSPLDRVESVAVLQGPVPTQLAGTAWALRGITSNTRYTTAEEKQALAAAQAPLGRPEATRSALIPIRKNPAWWNLSQDERRSIFEDRSHHTRIGLEYLPAIARRLHHCRDLSDAEPFDFLTWFDFAPKHAGAFDDLLAELRSSEEWKYVDRELDIRMSRR